MDAFIWNERYLTGESIVDTEHQELVRIINLVVEKVSSETPEDEIKDIMGPIGPIRRSALPTRRRVDDG
jgi:hemerythrin